MDDKRGSVRVQLLEEDGDEDYGLSWTLLDLTRMAAEFQASVPADLRDEIVFSVGAARGWGDDGVYPILRVYYVRPETDEEMAERLASEAEVRLAKARQREREERAEFERLKAKYES